MATKTNLLTEQFRLPDNPQHSRSLYDLLDESASNFLFSFTHGAQIAIGLNISDSPRLSIGL
jgi:hypothetical protein